MSRNKFMIISLCIAFVMLLGQFAGIRAFISKSGQGEEQTGKFAFTLFSNREDSPALLTQIREEAVKRRIEPVNAKVDRVWKAIPGYNGLEVDIERTYEKAKLNPPGTEVEYIYRQIKPGVTLNDLGAHPIYRGNPGKPMAALMINVAWGNEYIGPMLNTLDEANVKATFFLDGSWLKKNAEVAREIQKRGHQIENHAYSHPNMSRLEHSRARLEISKTKELLKNELNVDNRWFAPPSGDYNEQTVKLAAEQGLKTVLWTLDTVDWRKPPAASIVDKIERQVGAGSLILMHPTASSRDALKDMIKVIRKKGLLLGTVEETLSEERIQQP